MSITQKLRRYILETYLFTDDDGALGDDDSFFDMGIIDSTSVLELVMYLENEFGIAVDDAELLPDNLDSINRLSGFVARKQARAPA
jgi:acyl carrier protein